MWARWTAPEGGIALFETRGSNFDTLLATYSGTDLTDLVEVTSDDDSGEFFTSRVRFNAVGGSEYHIAVDGVHGADGEIVLQWRLFPTASRLSEIVGSPSDRIVGLGESASFSVDAVNPDPAGSPLEYRWRFNGVEVANNDSPTLTVPSVTSDELGTYYVEISNGFDSIFSKRVTLQINQSGQTGVDRSAVAEDKLARVSDGGGNEAALVALSLDRGPAGVSVASGFSGAQIFNTFGSTKEQGEPKHCGVVGGASQWFAYQSPAAGLLTVTTDGSQFDTVLAVYSGSGESFASLSEVACDNDGGADGQDSRVSFFASQGTIYFMAVDGVNGASGIANLNYALSPSLRVSGPKITDQGEFAFHVVTQPGQAFFLQSSLDLQTWETEYLASAPDGDEEVLLPISPMAGRRFFRAQLTE